MGGLLINGSGEVLYETCHGNMKPMPGLFAAGEATGGVHGGNRLGGNSLLECVVFGRIAGARAAAAVTLPRHISPLCPDTFAALRLAEREAVGGNIYKYTFELPSPFQTAGLAVGQYVNVRAEIAGESIIRPYSPLTRAGDAGRIELMVKADPTGGGKMSTYLSTLSIGSTLDFAGPIGGIDLYQSRVTKIGLIAGGVGIAPMLSIIRTVFRERSQHALKLIYAAGSLDDMPYHERLAEEAAARADFDVHFSLERPPDGWAHDTGFVNAEMIKANMFAPQDDLVIVICGPYPMCQALKGTLAKMGYSGKMVYSYM
jgi:NAD(P)H-flavin reductase